MDNHFHDLSNTVPTPERIRKAAKAAGISLNEAAMGNGMTRERKTTALLAVLSAWVTAYQIAHEAHTDPLSVEQLGMLVSSAVTEVTGGEVTPGLIVASWHTEHARMLVRELGRDALDNPDNPAGTLDSLADAMICILHAWRASTSSESSMVLDGVPYSAADALPIAMALVHAREAVARIEQLLPADMR